MFNVISVQSTVCYGYAGNKAAIFILQKLGVNANPIYTVQFSNQTRRKSFKGDIFSQEHINKVFNGLKENKFLEKNEALITGYLTSTEVGKVIMENVQYLKGKNSNFFYTCDPVFGDVGRDIYTNKNMPNWFLENALPYADLITPNVFEASYLTNIEIFDEYSALKVCKKLREKAINKNQIIAITSIEKTKNKIGILLNSKDKTFFLETPILDLKNTISGTGDIISALLTTFILNGLDLKICLEKACSIIYGILEITSKNKDDEISLIQAQNEINNPSYIFNAYEIVEK